jgi:RNA polymerase sigma-70 factor, ECF subfamily
VTALAPAIVRGVSADDTFAWVTALQGVGAERADALDQLHQLLLRAARHEMGRHRASLARLGREELDDLAEQAADDALVAVLAKLDTYRGDSRFTTWAYKFALLEAGVRARRRAWHDREVVLDPEAWTRVAAALPGPSEAAERAELWSTLRGLILEGLTPHQRRVLLAITVEGVPIDVLAERLDTTRGALYKTLHDARRKLRAGVAAAGLAEERLP